MNIYYLKKWRKSFRRNHRIIYNGWGKFKVEEYGQSPFLCEADPSWYSLCTENTESNIQKHYRYFEHDFLKKMLSDQRDEIKVMIPIK